MYYYRDFKKVTKLCEGGREIERGREREREKRRERERMCTIKKNVNKKKSCKIDTLVCEY